MSNVVTQTKSEISNVNMAKRKRKRGRSVQVSMDEYSQFLIIYFCLIYGLKISELVRRLMKPLIQFMAQTLQDDGYIDEFGRFTIDPEDIQTHYENLKNTAPYLVKLRDYKGESTVDLQDVISPSNMF